MNPDALLAAAEVALPVLVLVALVGTSVVTWLIVGERARRRVRDLEGQLSAAEAVIARLTDPAADLLSDVRGAHHRTQEEAPRA